MLDGSDQPDTRGVELLYLDFENYDRMLKVTKSAGEYFIGRQII